MEIDAYMKCETAVSFLKSGNHSGTGGPCCLGRLSVWKHRYGWPWKATAEILLRCMNCTWTSQGRADVFRVLRHVMWCCTERVLIWSVYISGIRRPYTVKSVQMFTRKSKLRYLVCNMTPEWTRFIILDYTPEICVNIVNRTVFWACRVSPWFLYVL